MNNQIIDDLIQSLLEIEGFTEFIEKSYDYSGEVDKLCNDFYEYKRNNGGITYNQSKQFEKVQIKKHLFLESQQTNVLYYINPDKEIDESELDDFRKDWNSSKTEEYTFKPREEQRFISYTEGFLYEKIDADWLLPKYSDSTHPLINATICKALMNAGRYNFALSYMANGLNYSLRYPHIYWHSKWGMLGSSIVIWDLAWMITHRSNYYPSNKNTDYWDKLKKKVFKLLYLSLTRFIDMAPDLPQTCDMFSNRADLFYYNFTIFQSIFAEAGFIVTRDIQYIADKKMAFLRACHFPGLTGLYQNQLHESRMMYEYDHLHPMYNEYIVSPKYIEDDVSWNEMAIRGLYRADALSISIYEEFRKHKLDFRRAEIEEIIIELRNIYHDVSPRNEFEKVIAVLKEAFIENASVPINELISILHKNKSTFETYDCYQRILYRLSSLSQKVRVVDSRIIDRLEKDYNIIERNYNWQSFDE